MRSRPILRKAPANRPAMTVWLPSRRRARSPEASRIIGSTAADAIEDYLRNRLRQRVRVKVAGGYREKGILKSTTVHQEFRVLRRMLNVAVRKKLLAANPGSGVEFPLR